MQRVFEVDVWVCPKCQGRMRVIAATMKADIVAKILECLGLPAEAPAMRPARAPPDTADPTVKDLVEIDWT